ncbi:MAG: hypothetical protein QM703_17135 [Gemmatales bacterium]
MDAVNNEAGCHGLRVLTLTMLRNSWDGLLLLALAVWMLYAHLDGR